MQSCQHIYIITRIPEYPIGEQRLSNNMSPHINLYTENRLRRYNPTYIDYLMYLPYVV